EGRQVSCGGCAVGVLTGGWELAGRRSDRECQEREVTAMMRLDSKPITPGLRTGRGQADTMPLLIQVPRVDDPHGRDRFWHPAAAGRVCPTWRGPSGTFRAVGRPRRRLRRGVRRAGWSLLVLVAMAGTFTMGWTTRGIGSPR